MTYLAIAVVGGVIWVAAVAVVAAACRAAAGSGPVFRARRGSSPNPNSISLLGRSSPHPRAVASSTARGRGEVGTGS
jgi:hypothetical protein